MHEALKPCQKALIAFAKRDMGDWAAGLSDWEVVDCYRRMLDRNEHSLSIVGNPAYARFRTIWYRYAVNIMPQLERWLADGEYSLALDFLWGMPRPSMGKKHAVPVGNPLRDAWLALAGRMPLSARAWISRRLYSALDAGRVDGATCAGMLTRGECGA